MENNLITPKEHDVIDTAYNFVLRDKPSVEQLRYFIRLQMAIKGVQIDLFTRETVEEIIQVFKEDGHVKA